MSDRWFRWREVDGRKGYAIASTAGCVAVICFIILSVGAAIVPPLIAHGSGRSFLVAGLLVCSSFAVLATVIRTHS
jgi:hypothetical protein